MFKASCFIRKNTPELKKRLEELGYISHIYNNDDANNIYVDKLGTYISVDIENQPYYIDCGENEELFLALAALRDDSNYMQWFTDGEKWLQNKQNDIEVIRYGAGNPIDFHKATVKELIEHFNYEKIIINKGLESSSIPKRIYYR
jgi:hypothetical protein